MSIELPQTHEARKQISALRRECFLSYRDISSAAGVSVRAIRNCERYNVLVAEARVRIDYLYDVCRLLSEIVEQRYIRKWLREPKEVFSGKSPLELVKENRTEELKKVINELLNESFS